MVIMEAPEPYFSRIDWAIDGNNSLFLLWKITRLHVVKNCRIAIYSWYPTISLTVGTFILSHAIIQNVIFLVATSIGIFICRDIAWQLRCSGRRQKKRTVVFGRIISLIFVQKFLLLWMHFHSRSSLWMERGSCIKVCIIAQDFKASIQVVTFSYSSEGSAAAW